MKRTLLFIACVLASITILAQEGDSNEYHPFVKEGKTWNYIFFCVENGGSHSDPYSYVVRGDTVIGDFSYKKIYHQKDGTERLAFMMREDGSKVFKLHPNKEEKLFFDFGRDDVGVVHHWQSEDFDFIANWMIYAIDSVKVNDNLFRRYYCYLQYAKTEQDTVDEKHAQYKDYWVEGIGSARYGIETDNLEMHGRAPGVTTYFVSCYENGECIFTADDFNIQTKPVADIAYRPFVEDDKVWKLGECDSGNPVPLVLYFYFDGDTIINGKTCKQMMYQRYVNPDYPRYDAISQQPSLCYEGAWYEEDKKVYEYDTIDKQFRLMYDFSLEANGIFEINYPPYVYLYQIGPRQTGGIKGFKGVYRDVLEWPEWSDGEWYKCAPWLEGVGTVYGPPTTNVFNVILADPHWFLMSCTAGDEVIYLNDVYEDGATPAEARKHRFDFTHTTKIQPKARKNSDAAPLYGEYNEQQLGINLDPLDDTYLVRIADESGKTVYKKNINAGGIVGLNIDISAYPEGRYTVTVENSLESFTGEFEAQTTGIEVVRNKKEVVGDYIYNLSGQRLSTPPAKGIYIRNGKKVVF